MVHRTDTDAAADQADVAAAAFARRGESDEWAVSRCMASRYRQQSDQDGQRA